MEYQNIDEAARREACEKVKKIAEALKRIRKKYYLCFNKISDADKKRYDELKAQMQGIAEENGLNKLNAELISDIDIQYGEDMPNDIDNNGNLSNGSIEDLHRQYLAALDLYADLNIIINKETVEKQLGKCLNKGIEVQNRIEKLSNCLAKYYSKEKLKEEKWGVLSQKFAEQNKKYVRSLLNSCYWNVVSKDHLNRKEGKDIIEECTNRNKLNESIKENSRV